MILIINNFNIEVLISILNDSSLKFSPNGGIGRHEGLSDLL